MLLVCYSLNLSLSLSGVELGCIFIDEVTGAYSSCGKKNISVEIYMYVIYHS